MFEATIKAVKDAEEHSGQTVMQAEERALAMLEEAKNGAAAVIREREQRGKAEALQRLKAEKEYGVTLEEQARLEAAARIEELKQTAVRKEAEVVRLLIAEVLHGKRQ